MTLDVLPTKGHRSPEDREITKFYTRISKKSMRELKPPASTLNGLRKKPSSRGAHDFKSSKELIEHIARRGKAF